MGGRRVAAPLFRIFLELAFLAALILLGKSRQLFPV
jgi:hypothetical protein